jgi:hypothetical protein
VKTLSCDIAIVGASMGGVAAAIASAGRDVILVAAHDWIGGQMTSQGVSAFDEHKYIEQFGGTRTYNEMRGRIRQHYINNRSTPELMPDGQPLNPGNGWVSRLCFEPEVGLNVLREMMPDSVNMLVGYEAVSADVADNTVHAVIIQYADGEEIRIEAKYFLDATDTGDLLPLTGTAYITGAESRQDTVEPNALDEAKPTEVQSFTYCFAVEFHPDEDHTIDKPDNYEAMRDEQPYSLILHDKQGNPRYFHMFKDDEAQGNKPFWTYRRINHGGTLDGIDLALINWHGNDYYGGNILDVSPDEKARILEEAKQLALGFLYWLQTECPRDDGGEGYPEFKLITEAMGTDDGLSIEPYIRESRRIVGWKRITEQDISAETNPYARAKNMRDSVGIGWYAIDLHPCVGNKTVSMFMPTKPFQISLRSMLPKKTKNLIPACKNIATTHLTNGAYRLHLIEWNIGESAMLLALYCVDNDMLPGTLVADSGDVPKFQYQLVKQGIPIAWAIDVPQSHPLFVPSQMLLSQDILRHESQRRDQMEINPDEPLQIEGDFRAYYQVINSLVGSLGDLDISGVNTWTELCEIIAPLLEEKLG